MKSIVANCSKMEMNGKKPEQALIPVKYQGY